MKTISVTELRNKLEEDYFPMSNALAIDDSISLDEYDLPKHLEILDLNDTDSIVKWILKNAKKVR